MIQGLLRDYGIFPDEVDDCLKWALGEGYETKPPSIMDKLFNAIHPESPTIHAGMSIRTAASIISNGYLTRERQGFMAPEDEKTFKEAGMSTSDAMNNGIGIAGKISQAVIGGINEKIAAESISNDIGKIREVNDQPGRNDPCHCGSTRKYKKCCLEKDEDILREAQEEKDTQRLIAMCDGKTPFKLPEAIKFLGAHTDGWMPNHLDDIKYLKAIVRALRTFPASGSDSFVTLYRQIYTRDDLINEYEGCLKEMEGKLARKDYLIEYALCEFMKKDAFIGNTGDRAEKDPDFELDDGKCEAEAGEVNCPDCGEKVKLDE